MVSKYEIFFLKCVEQNGFNFSELIEFVFKQIRKKMVSAQIIYEDNTNS